MKSLLAKTLMSTALVMATAATQAESTPPRDPRMYSPELIQQWEKRDAIIAKEQMDRQRSGRPAPESAMEWMQRQPQLVD